MIVVTVMATKVTCHNSARLFHPMNTTSGWKNTWYAHQQRYLHDSAWFVYRYMFPILLFHEGSWISEGNIVMVRKIWFHFHCFAGHITDRKVSRISISIKTHNSDPFFTEHIQVFVNIWTNIGQVMACYLVDPSYILYYGANMGPIWGR